MNLDHSVFVESCMEHLDHAEQAILDLEQGGEFRPLLQRVYRCLHTVKGDASTVGNTLAATTAHAMEDELEVLMTAGPPFTRAHASQLLNRLDHLRAAIHAA
ncbi:Hpt domain-containing protein [Megalodesulfovibrio gigas]|uniref:Putative chemotaxis protein CheA n=1 Tax=Megalodesulfovibrio gigas (strain ATCC 19364 / DSM 1382 / NCIMB 9332 / VKM B-1759) TaxID=1121448 RepID=T2G9Y4_MEGG1|nr:Hpt domain-containing protein [Megalodesulfovibrio gigas]AGW12717.1 putative chemotaxis protein CheA [Megalodesulfovibrio gigas DSM 1382 = ATCC 19364]